MTDLYVGLISGTSMDAVDAALVEIQENGKAQLLHALSHPVPADLRTRTLELAHRDLNLQLRASELDPLDIEIASLFAEAVEELLSEAAMQPGDIYAIGSHGQTIRHAPDADPPFSLQLGDPGLIAKKTGITTVGDLRRADMEAGGQGAPLAPALHKALFSSDKEVRCVVNIGGISNITILSPDRSVIGYDTGPGNCLMDDICQTRASRPFDINGELSSRGTVIKTLLKSMLKDPYFKLPYPKSTGREYFTPQWLDKHLRKSPKETRTEDLLRTLCELTAQTVIQQISEQAPDCQRCFVCGGGAHNPVLMNRLAELLSPVKVSDTSELGLSPDHVEAVTFAWLAMRTMHNLPGNLPSVTGAREAVVLGKIYEA